MPIPNLKWLKFADFRGGIKQRTGLFDTMGEVSNNPAIAAVTNTFRCIGLHQGGLGPMPKRDMTFNRTSPPNGATNAGVTGFRTFGPSFTSSFVYGATSGTNTELPLLNNTANTSFVVCYSYASGGNTVMRAERWPVYGSSTTYDLIQTSTAAVAFSGLYSPAYLGLGRSTSSTTDPTQVGPPVMVGSMIPTGNVVAGNALLFAWPDPRAWNSGAAYVLGIGQGRIVAHQNRFISFQNYSWSQGGGGGLGNGVSTYNSEGIIFSFPNDVYGAYSSFLSGFGSEDPSAIGVAGSLSASDLLIVRHQYGGYLIQGDVSNPTVRRLPGVASTEGVECNGALSPIGFAYGTFGGGVHVWGGGDSTTNISADLDPGFWHTAESVANVTRFRGQFDSWRTYMLVPNNWVYDYGLRSWWRLEDPSVAQFWMYQTDPISPRFYGTKLFLSNSSTDVVHSWNGAQLTDSYSWQSHPMKVSVEQLISVKEAVLTVQSTVGAGTVTVTLTGFDGVSNQSVALSFPYVLNSSQAQVIRKAVSFSAQWVRVRIQAAATSTSDPAPIVDSLELGYDEVTHIPRS